MRRREFVQLLTAATVEPPLTVGAQQGVRRPTIGFLGPATPSVAGERIAAFEGRLKELGWTPDDRVRIEYRWAEGKSERFAQLAGELTQLEVDIIVTWGTETALAAKKVTSAIPIVFTIVGDPVGSGLVRSLARPGGNVTGLSTQHGEAAGKRVELLRELLPKFGRLAIMANLGNPAGVLEMREATGAARTVGIEITTLDVHRAEDIAPAIASVTHRVEALYVVGDAFFNTHRERISALTVDARLPTMHGFREIVAAGGLISYGPNYFDLFRRTADYVDKVLKGGKPADLPVEQPTKFELAINLKTTKALGLTVPPSLLARADEVIE